MLKTVRTMAIDSNVLKYIRLVKSRYDIPLMIVLKLENFGKNRCKSPKISKICEKMENSLPDERVIKPNQNNMEIFGNLQP